MIRRAMVEFEAARMSAVTVSDTGVRTTRRVLLIAGILLVAANLRGAITSVGPLLETIRRDEGLTASQAGLLSALPLLTFAVFSPQVPRLARRVGMERLLWLALLTLTAGILLRSVPVPGLLWLGTILLGMSIAVGNVLLPALLKRDFPDQVAQMTSLYSVTMGIVGAIVSGFAVPLAGGLPGGWRTALGCTAGLALVAIAVWLPQAFRGDPPTPLADQPVQAMDEAEVVSDLAGRHVRVSELASGGPARLLTQQVHGLPDGSVQRMRLTLSPEESVEHTSQESFDGSVERTRLRPPPAEPVPRTPWRSALAWQVTAFMGLQSFGFYIVLAWFPAILHSEGASEENSGWLLLVLQVLGVSMSAVIPLLANKLSDQRLLAAGGSLLSFTGYLGLILAPNLAVLWVVIVGLASGVCFVLALFFFTLRSADSYAAATLSGMAQSIGYLFAMLGPVVFGALHDLTTGWTVPMIMLLIAAGAQACCGFGAGRNLTV
jgi:cyanate permease